jgi:hypothetical protein
MLWVPFLERLAKIDGFRVFPLNPLGCLTSEECSASANHRNTQDYSCPGLTIFTSSILL